MAKKRVSAATTDPGGTQRKLSPDWQEDVPEPVLTAAASYLEKYREHNKLAEQVRSSREACIETMKEHGVKRIRIDDGKQWLECEDEAKLKTKKVKVEKDDTRQSARA